MKFFTFFLIFCIISCSETNQSTEPPKAVQTDNPLKSKLDSLVDKTFRTYASKAQTAGFSLAVINDTITGWYHYGETRKGNGILPNNQTLYEIGSLTKTFTAIVTHTWLTNILAKDISTPISNYLPPQLASNMMLNGSKVTFKQLLNHTSGLPRIPNDLPNNFDPYNGYDSMKVFSYLSNNNLLRMPGTLPLTEQDAVNYYSNLAYGLSGIILERNYNISLQSVFNNFIFNPLSMSNTTFNSIENVANRAYPHNNTNDASYWHLSGLAGAGGLKSCLADLIKYAQAQLKATNGSSFLACQTPTIQINGKDFFGLGWEFYYTKNGKRITVKDGGTGGFTAFIAFDKKAQKAVIALFNNHNENNPSEPFVNLMEEFF